MTMWGTMLIALASVVAHPVRAGLAALGVVFGVAAVIAMLAISKGAEEEALRQIQVLGTDKIVLQSVQPFDASGEQKRIDMYGITEADRVHIGEQFDNISAILPIRDLRQNLFKRATQTQIGVFACPPNFAELTRSAVTSGRFILPADEQDTNPVCVLGDGAARELFAFENPVGKNLTIGGSLMRVVGIINNPNSYQLPGGHGLNGQVYVPMRTARALFGATTNDNNRLTRIDYDYLYIVVADVGSIIDTAERLRTYMGTTHDKTDWEVTVPYELLKQKEATQRIFSVVMGSIAAISLLVGGIGIMNIMLANVYERMREIGTRRALGARSRDILTQFLIESVALTSAGGVVGVALGWCLTKAVESYASMPIIITPSSVIISVAVSIATGVLFGTFPAWKAANLDPIVALRHE
jgi:putative ABC transport system permease protein